MKQYIKVFLELIKILLLIPVAEIVGKKYRSAWIITERPDQARDNGFCFFKYIRENHTDENVYYIIDQNGSDFNKIQDFGNIIQFDSVKHYIAFLSSRIHISSHVNGCCPSNTVSIFRKIKNHIGYKDVFLPHGDTSTTFVTALVCFYMQIPVGHVEAGLRTYNIYSPYPEEFNRQAVGIISKYNFAPTELSKQNLLNEGKKAETIYVTGNTAIDALKTTVREDYNHPELEWAEGSRLIMITAHRRENLGEPMKNMFRAIQRVMVEHPDVKAIYPIHMNPVVRETADSILGRNERIRIIEPLEVLDFHNFLSRSYLILTDSGGIQE